MTDLHNAAKMCNATAGRFCCLKIDARIDTWLRCDGRRLCFVERQTVLRNKDEGTKEKDNGVDSGV